MKRIGFQIALVVLFCCFFILVPILPDVQIYRPKLLGIELLSFVILSTFIFSTVVSNRISYPSNKRVIISSFILLTYIFLRYIFTPEKPLAVNEVKRWTLSIFLMYVISTIDMKHYSVMITFYIIGSFLSVIYGLLQHTGGVWILQVPKMERVMSMFGNPIFFAVHIVNLVPFIASRMVLTKKTFYKLVYFLILVTSLVTLYFTKTRAAFIALLVSSLVLILLLIQDIKKRIKFIVITLFSFVCFILVTKNIWLRQQAHLLIWRDTLRMWLSYPFLGVGLGRYHIEFVNFASEELRKIWPEKQFIINDAHNEYLQFLSENGIIGFFILMIMFCSFFVQTVKYITTSNDKTTKINLAFLFSAAVGVLVQNLFSVDLRFIISNVYLFITMGFIMGYMSEIQEKHLFFTSKMVKIIFLLITSYLLGWIQYADKSLVFVSLVKVNLQGIKICITTEGKGLLQQMLHPYVASYRLKKEKDFFDEKIVDAAKTLSELEQLKQRYPDKSIIYERIAWIYAKEKQFDKAVENYLKALQLNPNSYAAYNNLGNIMFLLGNRQKAVEFYTKSIQINPNQVDARLNLGILYYYDGKLNLAAEQFNQVLKLDPTNEKAIYYLKKMRE